MKMNVIYFGQDGKAKFGTIEVEEKPKNYKIIDSNEVPLSRVMIPKADIGSVVRGVTTKDSVLCTFNSHEDAVPVWNKFLQGQVDALETYYLERLDLLQTAMIK